MKKVILFLLAVAAGYFGYQHFAADNTSTDTVAVQDVSEGIITDTFSAANGILEETRDVVEVVQENSAAVVEELESTTESAVETVGEGITDLADAGVEIVGEVVAGTGMYVDYSDTDISSLDGKIVLDFYASWCPACRKLESDINDSLLDIPAGVNLVKVNYDTETALKQQYGVTRQHTLVQIDQQGNLIKKWSGGSTLESILSEIQ